MVVEVFIDDIIILYYQIVSNVKDCSRFLTTLTVHRDSVNRATLFSFWQGAIMGIGCIFKNGVLTIPNWWLID